jgi:hypothetical protein
VRLHGERITLALLIADRIEEHPFDGDAVGALPADGLLRRDLEIANEVIEHVRDARRRVRSRREHPHVARIGRLVEREDVSVAGERPSADRVLTIRELTRRSAGRRHHEELGMNAAVGEEVDRLSIG